MATRPDGDAPAASPGARELAGRPDSIAQAFISGTAWIGIGSAAQAILRLALISALSKRFDPTRYGYWAVLAATAEILAPLAAVGLTYGYMRYSAGVSDRSRTHRNFLGAVIVVLVISATISGLLTALSGAFARAFMGSSPLGRRVVLVGATFVLWTSLEVFLRYYYSTELQMGRRALLATSRFALEFVAAVVGIALGGDLVQIVLCILAARALPPLVALAAIVRRKGLARPSFAEVSTHVRCGLPLELAGSASVLIRFSDRYALGAFGLAAAVGGYSATYDISSCHLLAVVAIEAALFPVMAALVNRGERRRARWMYLAAVKYLLLATVPAALVLSVAARPILMLVTGAEYADIGTREEPWIAWGIVCYSVAKLTRSLLGVANRAMQTMVATWLLVPAKVLLLVVFIRWFDVLGAGIATFAAFFLLMVTMLVMSRDLLAAGPPASPEDSPPAMAPLRLPTLLATALAAGLAGVPLHFLAAPTPGRLLAGFGAYALVYGVGLLALGVVRPEEVRALWRLMRTGRAAGLPFAESVDEV